MSSVFKSHAHVFRVLAQHDPSASSANPNLCHLLLGATRDPTPATLILNQKRSSIKLTEGQIPNGKETEQRREEGRLRLSAKVRLPEKQGRTQ